MFHQITISRRHISFRPLISSPFLVVGILTIFGAFLRVYHLGDRSLWLDEAKLFWISRGSISEVIARHAQSNSAPPFYAVLINLVSRIGESETVLRSVSALAGIVAIPAMFLFARLFVGLLPAYLSSFLAAISLNLIVYSQELREYSLTFLIAIWMLATFHNFLVKPVWTNWFWVTISSTTGLLTQYGLALLILSFNIILLIMVLLERSQRDKTKILFARWTISQVILLGVVFVVYESSLKHQFAWGGFKADSYLTRAYWDGSLSSLLRLSIINTYEIFDFALLHPSLLLFFSGIGFLIAIQHRERWSFILLFTIPMLITYIAGILRLYPYSGGRQAIFLIPMILMLSVFGFEFVLDKLQFDKFFLKQSTIFIIAIIAFGVPGIKYTWLSFQGGENSHILSMPIENVRPLTSILKRSFIPGDRIYAGCRSEPAFRYYYRQNQDEWIVAQSKNVELNLEQIRNVVFVPGRIWMIFSHCIPGEMEAITKYVADTRTVQLTSSSEGAWLFLSE